MLKLSIITVNLNNAEGLRKTIESVVTQTYANFEHIIIDGGSTDGSVEVIKEYEDRYTHIEGGLYWVSEPDKGIYNGMNKGIKVAKGEYCLFLNSGDWLIENKGLEKVFEFQPVENIVYCNMLSPNFHFIYPDNLTYYFFYKKTLGHQSTIIKRELFDKIGYYNESFKISSDWEFFFKAIVFHYCTYRHLNYFLTYFEHGGISSNKSHDELRMKEKNIVFTQVPKIIMDSAEDLIKYKDGYNGLVSSNSIKVLLRAIQLKNKLLNNLNYKKNKKRT